MSLRAPPGVSAVRVTSTEEMRAALAQRIAWCDALVMAAAVCDWRPRHVSRRKLKKRKMPPALLLEPTPDILQALKPRKGRRIYVGFAAETGDPVPEARRKLRDKALDLIVANDVSRPDSGFDVNTNRVVLIPADGRIEALPLMSKTKVAGRIVKWLERRRARP